VAYTCRPGEVVPPSVPFLIHYALAAKAPLPTKARMPANNEIKTRDKRNRRKNKKPTEKTCPKQKNK
jgi:hypothetical protein